MTQIPLYFLPGTQCDQRLWQTVFELLPKHFVPHPITLPQGNNPLEIIHKLHEKLFHDKHYAHPVNLLGFSLGGYLASLYAANYPTHINKLLVLANAPCSLSESELNIRKQTLAYISSHGYTGIPRKRIAQLLADCNKNNKHIITTISEMDKRCGQKMLEQQLANTTDRFNLIPQLIIQQFPIRFIIGTENNLVNTIKLEQDIIGSDISLCLINDCGHMIPLECPQAVAEHVSHFFN